MLFGDTKCSVAPDGAAQQLYFFFASAQAEQFCLYNQKNLLTSSRN